MSGSSSASRAPDQAEPADELKHAAVHAPSGEPEAKRPSGPGRLRVGGLSPLSTCDWPGRLAATVFCQGCPLRCRYCHNPGLIPVTGPAGPSWEDIMALLDRRRGLLDAVVFSGGEPTLQRGLAAAMADARRAGFLVGLHTAGTNPGRLSGLLGQLDWVGLDVKAPLRLYPQITGSATAGGRARSSLRAILASRTPLEVRVTLDPALDEAALTEMADFLAAEGVRDVALQACRDRGARVIRRPGDLSERLLTRWQTRFTGLTMRE